MTVLEQIAEELTETIARRWLNLTVDSKSEMRRLITKKIRPFFKAQQEFAWESPLDAAVNQAQRHTIITALKNARSTGVTNVEFVGMGILRFGSRKHELVQQGYKITKVREQGRTFRYFLAPEHW